MSIILNITPDHLNRHHTMENYINLKKNITINQDKSNLCILNYEDAHIRSFSDGLNTKVMYFSGEHVLENGIYLDGDDIFYRKNDDIEHVCNVNELRILGKHNYENVMAGVGAAKAMGIPMEVIHETIISFNG